MSSQTKKQSVNVPPMSTEIRFMSLCSLSRWGPGSSADVSDGLERGGVLLGVLAGPVVVDLLGADAALVPLGAQRGHVDDQVVGRRVPRGEVLDLDLGAAAGAVVLQDPAVAGVRAEGVLVPVRVDDRLVDLARVTIVDQGPGLVVLVGRSHVLGTD